MKRRALKLLNWLVFTSAATWVYLISSKFSQDIIWNSTLVLIFLVTSAFFLNLAIGLEKKIVLTVEFGQFKIGNEKFVQTRLRTADLVVCVLPRKSTETIIICDDFISDTHYCLIASKKEARQFFGTQTIKLFETTIEGKSYFMFDGTFDQFKQFVLSNNDNILIKAHRIS